jgi:hypothetical protein
VVVVHWIRHEITLGLIVQWINLKHKTEEKNKIKGHFMSKIIHIEWDGPYTFKNLNSLDDERTANTTLKLDDDGKSLLIFSLGTLSINGMDLVKVIGSYQKIKNVGRYTFYNEIDASGGSVEKIK